MLNYQMQKKVKFPQVNDEPYKSKVQIHRHFLTFDQSPPPQKTTTREFCTLMKRKSFFIRVFKYLIKSIINENNLY